VGSSEPAPAADVPAVAEVEALLYREARLLDENRYEDWQALFTEDARYWLPIDGDGSDIDPERSISIIYDDLARIDERVFRTLHTRVLDQNPRSRTVHMVSNVEVEPERVDGDVVVRCTQLIGELRPGGRGQVGLNDQRYFAGRCEYRLREDEAAGDWRISLKKVVLLNADQPIYNLTFIV
jgi:3-phenylpropionate/cinnamic acid dioxygenase small subunit